MQNVMYIARIFISRKQATIILIPCANPVSCNLLCLYSVARRKLNTSSYIFRELTECVIIINMFTLPYHITTII